MLEWMNSRDTLPCSKRLIVKSIIIPYILITPLDLNSHRDMLG